MIIVPATGSNPGGGSDSSSEISEESSFCHPIERANRQNGIRIHQNQIPIRSGFESHQHPRSCLVARVAQSVEHWSNKPTVAGSIPVVSKQENVDSKLVSGGEGSMV